MKIAENKKSLYERMLFSALLILMAICGFSYQFFSKRVNNTLLTIVIILVLLFSLFLYRYILRIIKK